VHFSKKKKQQWLEKELQENIQQHQMEITEEINKKGENYKS